MSLNWASVVGLLKVPPPEPEPAPPKAVGPLILLILGQSFGPLGGKSVVIQRRARRAFVIGSLGVSSGSAAAVRIGVVGLILKLCRPLRGQGFLIILRHDVVPR